VLLRELIAFGEVFLDNVCQVVGILDYLLLKLLPLLFGLNRFRFHCFLAFRFILSFLSLLSRFALNNRLSLFLDLRLSLASLSFDLRLLLFLLFCFGLLRTGAV
jgi:hypothetical protein